MYQNLKQSIINWNFLIYPKEAEAFHHVFHNDQWDVFRLNPQVAKNHFYYHFHQAWALALGQEFQQQMQCKSRLDFLDLMPPISFQSWIHLLEELCAENINEIITDISSY